MTLFLGCNRQYQKAITQQEFSNAVEVVKAGHANRLHFLGKKIGDEDIAQLAELSELYELGLAF